MESPCLKSRKTSPLKERPSNSMQIELPPRLRAAFQPRRAAPSNPTFPAGSCSLLYLNPLYDVEVGSHSNQRLELVFLDHCYGWLKTAGVLIFVIPNHALSPRSE